MLNAFFSVEAVSSLTACLLFAGMILSLAYKNIPRYNDIMGEFEDDFSLFARQRIVGRVVFVICLIILLFCLSAYFEERDPSRSTEREALKIHA